MPIVHVDFWEGVGEEKVKKMIRGITDVIVDLGVPEQAVEVIVYEIPKTHWGVGGEPASEKLKDISPPKQRHLREAPFAKGITSDSEDAVEPRAERDGKWLIKVTCPSQRKIQNQTEWLTVAGIPPIIDEVAFR